MAALGTWACSADGVDTTATPVSPVILTRSDGPTGNAGVVSSSVELATLAGVEMLEEGGNAFDTAVAVASTLTVVQPTHSNIFGGYGNQSRARVPTNDRKPYACALRSACARSSASSGAA